MSIELPVLRLGLAGFSVQQKADLAGMLQRSTPGRHVWQLASFAEADGWWLNGARSTSSATTIRVAPAIPTERSLHINMQDVDRPIGFSVPVAFEPPSPGYTFDAASLSSINQVLEKFESWLQPVAAQFLLAGRIIEQETVIGNGVYHVMLNGSLIAVVNMQGDIGVLASAGPADFDDAIWVRQPGPTAIPESFVRTTLSELMWQYAIRTSRDVLPKRYRAGLLYFRRPPRLPQRFLTDSHLLLIRELSIGAGTFADLQQRTGMGAAPLARVLAALYLVGSITSNAKRATVTHAAARAQDAEPSQGIQHSIVPSALDTNSAQSIHPIRRHGLLDFTVPVPICPR